MLQVLAQYFRLPINVAKPFSVVNDLLSASVPNVPAGAALEWDFVFCDGTPATGTLLDLSVFDSIEFRIQDQNSPHAQNTYIAISIPASEFQAIANYDDFTGGTKQHITVVISSADNVLSPNNGEANYWLCLYGKLTAAAAAAQTPAKEAGDAVPLCFFKIRTQDSGIPAAADQLALRFKVGSKIPLVCSPELGGDGLTRDLYLAKLPSGNYTLQIGDGYSGAGQTKYSFLCDPAHGGDSLYRDLYLQKADNGIYVPVIDPIGHS